MTVNHKFENAIKYKRHTKCPCTVTTYTYPTPAAVRQTELTGSTCFHNAPCMSQPPRVISFNIKRME